MLKDRNPTSLCLADVRVTLIDKCQRFSPETSFEPSGVTPGPRHRRFSYPSANNPATDVTTNNQVTNRVIVNDSFFFGETQLELCRFSETGNRGNQMLDD